jgi:hypothetical protein
MVAAASAMAPVLKKPLTTVQLMVVFTSVTTQLVMTADVSHNTVVAQMVQT